MRAKSSDRELMNMEHVTSSSISYHGDRCTVYGRLWWSDVIYIPIARNRITHTAVLRRRSCVTADQIADSSHAS